MKELLLCPVNEAGKEKDEVILGNRGVMARRGRQDVKHKQSASPSRQLLVKGVGLHTAAPKPEREVWVRWRASVGSHLETRRKSTEQRAYPVLEFGSVLVVIYL